MIPDDGDGDDGGCGFYCDLFILPEGEKNVYRVFNAPQRESQRRGHQMADDYAAVNLVDDECNMSSDGQVRTREGLIYRCPYAVPCQLVGR